MTGIEICFAAAILSEAVIAWLYCSRLFERKLKAAIAALSFLLGYAGLFAVSLLGDTVINISSFFLISGVLLFLNFEIKILPCLVHAALLTFLMTVTDLFSNLLLGLFGHAFTDFANTVAVIVPMTTISKFLYLLLSLLAAHILSPQKLQAERKNAMLLCILPLVSVGIAMLVCYLGMNTELTDATQIMIVVTLLSLLVMNLVFLVLQDHLSAANAERTSLRLSLLREEENAAYFKSRQEQTEQQRVLLHDIKNHLSAIHALAEDNNAPAIASYVSDLQDTFLASAQIPKLCDDPILNAVLLHTVQSCKDQSVEFEYDVRAGCTASMDAVAVTSLYGNLLSNAVEAASVSSEKRIELTAICNRDQGSVFITVINSCDEAPIPDRNGLFRSRKQDNGLHGIGLMSIERVVQEHHGISKQYYNEAEHLFHSVVQLPICCVSETE